MKLLASLVLLFAVALVNTGKVLQTNLSRKPRESTPPPLPTSTVPPTDGCEACINTPLSITDTWVGQCFPLPSSDNFGRCSCLCADIFCEENEVIDESTCVEGSHISDCRCIKLTTPIPSSSTTPGPLSGCEGCVNSKLSVNDTAASYCYPNTSQPPCTCLCGDIICREGEMIDKSSCVDGGDINACKCISVN